LAVDVGDYKARSKVLIVPGVEADKIDLSSWRNNGNDPFQLSDFGIDRIDNFKFCLVQVGTSHEFYNNVSETI